MGVTLKACIKKAEKKKDGTWAVKIRVVHNKTNTLISTPYYINRNQLTLRSYEISDKTIIEATDRIIAQYKSYILNLGLDVDKYDAKGLAKYFTEQNTLETKKQEGINFIDVMNEYRTKLINQNRDGYADNINRTIALLTKYTGGQLFMQDITSVWLETLEEKMLSTMKQNSANIHLRNIRTVFNYARDQYNDEDTGVMLIKHYPFRKFKFTKPETPRKRNLDTQTIQKITNYPERPTHA